MNIQDSGARREFQSGAVRENNKRQYGYYRVHTCIEQTGSTEMHGKEGGNRMIQDSEEWLPVVGYENFYEVSSHGRVRSKRINTRIVDKQNKIMRQKGDRNGYFRVNLNDGNKCKACLVSRLVAEAFLSNPEKLPVVGHNDDNKVNNHVSNLYWTTTKENNYHNGKLERFQLSHKEKIRHIAAILSNPVIGTNCTDGEKIYFKSMQEAGKNGFDCGKISMCCSGKRNLHKGYEWRKAE